MAVASINAVFLWNNIDMSLDGNKIKLDATAKMLSTGAFGTIDETFKAGPRNWKLQYDGYFNGAAGQNEQTLVADFNNGQARTWIVYPEGNVSTKRKYTGSGLIDKFSPIDEQWDQIAKLSVGIQVSGAVTPTTVP